MKIGAREVGPGARVFIIAECGSNHAGSLDRALALIDAAADAGADAAKFQRFRVGHFLVPRPNEETLRPYELPDEWLPKLRARCDERGIEFLCTAFDLDSLEVVDPFVNAHKIGSWEAPYQDYLRSVKNLGKPFIASAGRVTHIRADIILRCVSAYPAPLEGYLRPSDIPTRGWSGWGVSDHTLDPLTVPAAATALGACVVEKHMKRSIIEGWTPDWAPLHSMEGNKDPYYDSFPITPDSPVSIDEVQFAKMVSAVRLTEKAVRG